MKSLIVAVTGMALAISAGAAAAAPPATGGTTPTPTPTPVPTPTPPPAPSPITTKSTPVQAHLRNAVIQNAPASGKFLNPGFTTIDGTQRLSCTSSCTIVVSAMVQVKTPGRWAICAVVDGNNINPPCPFQASSSQTGNWVTGNSQQSWPVGAGTHTVQTQVFVSSAAALGSWQTTRHITISQSLGSPL